MILLGAVQRFIERVSGRLCNDRQDDGTGKSSDVIRQSKVTLLMMPATQPSTDE